MRSLKTAVAAVAVLGLLVAAVPGAYAGAIHDAGLFTTVLSPNDDDSVGPVNIGFGIDFFGLNGGNQTTLFVNNNGNVTFNLPLSEFTPFPLLTTNVPMIVPFFADVDTRAAGSDVVRYGQATLDGHAVFGVNWINVGYFFRRDEHLNSFQLIITDRSDTGAGNFDFEFNYDAITWETGQASDGDENGLGGDSARAGWSNGTNKSFELAGSAINGALLDTNCPDGATGLTCHSLNSNILGQYIFSVRNGAVIPPDGGTPNGVPAPGTLVLLGAALLGAGMTALLRRRAK
jgi:hypothetical protein